MKAEMKNAILWVILLVIVGIAGFLYRATLEAPQHATNSEGTVCPQDAYVCPDGTSVSRAAPSCEFAACPAPNVTLPAAGIAFALPAGYLADTEGNDAPALAAYEKTALAASSTQRDRIVVSRYAIPSGEDANAVMLSHTTFGASGMPADSMEDFMPVIIDGRTYQTIVIERFEGQVRMTYYLPRDADVLRFDAYAYGVADWNDPSLKARSLPAVSALESLLSTLKETP